jgi:hypothetical protein
MVERFSTHRRTNTSSKLDFEVPHTPVKVTSDYMPCVFRAQWLEGALMILLANFLISYVISSYFVSRWFVTVQSIFNEWHALICIPEACSFNK